MKEVLDGELATAATWLQSTGLYGLLAATGWALWRINEKKDAALRDLYEKVLEMGHVQTVAVTKVEAAIVALKQAIDELRHKLS